MQKGDMPVQAADLLKGLPQTIHNIKAELAKRVFGQHELIGQLLVTVFARGHCLITGVPGLAKTLLVNTLAEIADLQFSRIQFTPDMMPMDITGSEILEEDHSTGKRELKFIKGPIFSQLVLADEINRTPPKTQAALLEAMQEGRVTIAGKKYELQQPFFVLATQNPIEQEGTYPLPEAQLDRFMFSLNVSYPDYQDELKLLLSTTSNDDAVLDKVICSDEIVAYQKALRYLHIPTSVAEYTLKLVSATRPGNPLAGKTVNKYLRWGAGPRACQYLALAGKVYAAIDGRYNVAVSDIQAAAYAVLRHRIILNYQAEANDVTPEKIIEHLLKTVKH